MLSKIIDFYLFISNCKLALGLFVAFREGFQVLDRLIFQNRFQELDI